jgi:hypothetical protein
MKILAWRRGLKLLLILLGWSASTSGLILVAVFQGFLVPSLGGPFSLGGQPLVLVFYYIGIAGVSFIASLLVNDPGPSLVGFFVSYGFAGSITFIVLSLPATFGATSLPDVLVRISLSITFDAFFPFALMAGLVGTILGILLSDWI